MLFASKLRRMKTYQEGLPPIKSQHSLFMWSSEIVWQTKTIIAPLPQCLRPQTWLDENLPWGPSIHKVTCPINYIFLLDHMRNVRCISFNLIHKVIKLGRVVTYNEELQLISHIIFQSGGFLRLLDKLNTLYLHMYQTNCNETWQNGDLQ